MVNYWETLVNTSLAPVDVPALVTLEDRPTEYVHLTVLASIQALRLTALAQAAVLAIGWASPTPVPGA